MRSKVEIVIGSRYGSLTVKMEMPAKRGGRQVVAVCDCGSEKQFYFSALHSGLTKSCGCQRGRKIGDAVRVHGHTNNFKLTPTYVSWAAMKQRCLYKDSEGYKNYGGRGVTVCERWLSFENFLADMGERPDGMTLDRWPNKSGNYEPGNCRWATAKMQGRNRCDNTYLAVNGVTRTLSEWSELRGIGEDTIRARIKKLGWSVEKAVMTDVHRASSTR